LREGSRCIHAEPLQYQRNRTIVVSANPVIEDVQTIQAILRMNAVENINHPSRNIAGIFTEQEASK
jgi:hypothetical protein